MAHFEVIVQYESGSPYHQARVADGYSYEELYTDERGRCMFERDTYKLRIYVNGTDCGDHPPGKILVTVNRSGYPV